MNWGRKPIARFRESRATVKPSTPAARRLAVRASTNCSDSADLNPISKPGRAFGWSLRTTLGQEHVVLLALLPDVDDVGQHGGRGPNLLRTTNSASKEGSTLPLKRPWAASPARASTTTVRKSLRSRPKRPALRATRGGDGRRWRRPSTLRYSPLAGLALSVFLCWTTG
jgi:hypothetical protein